ncbi:ATP-dependent RNA helicase DeaD [bacterium HR33]|nr:ATP-dependent RNA helicase DeaD [bacterium HR33]
MQLNPQLVTATIIVAEEPYCGSFTTEVVVHWRFEPVFDAAHRAALETGKSLVYVCPPAAWAIAPLLNRLKPAASGTVLLAVVPERELAISVAQAIERVPELAPAHPCTGLARTERLLRDNSLRSLAATVPDAMELVGRAALKLETISYVLIGWPESMRLLGQLEQLDLLLAEAARAQRLVLTSRESAAADFLERHAHRAPVVQAAPLPAESLGSVWYGIAPLEQRPHALRTALDLVNPIHPLVLDPNRAPEHPEPVPPPGSAEAVPHDWAVVLDLPSADLLAWLKSQAKDVAILLSAGQVEYLQLIASPLKPLKLSSAPDRARDLLFTLRQRVRDRLEEGPLWAELFTLEALFDEYDPALVAAAALSLSARPPRRDETVSAWVRLRVNVGRRDRIKVSDLVGALLNGVRLPKDDVGRVELHDGFALIDVRAPVAEHALRELNGMTLRGKKVSAVVDPR